MAGVSSPLYPQMTISVDDLVSSLNSSHIGQEAMDLAALQAQLAQAFFNQFPSSAAPTPIPRKRSTHTQPCNTPTASSFSYHWNPASIPQTTTRTSAWSRSFCFPPPLHPSAWRPPPPPRTSPPLPRMIATPPHQGPPPHLPLPIPSICPAPGHVHPFAVRPGGRPNQASPFLLSSNSRCSSSSRRASSSNSGRMLPTTTVTITDITPIL
ncbi:hypothetical protein BDQ17DRAFT_1325570 [Cyathus striatus]|nr:hypothetical protein BDQ17DRAFT_1325570 [Cyathus striatus]